MADNILFELVSPEKLLLSVQAQEVIIPGSEGYLTVMANHARTMTAVIPGIVTVKHADGQTKQFVVFGGFADITPESCAILAQSAQPIEDLDHAALDKQIEEARKALDEAKTDEHKNKAEDFLHQLTTVQGVLTMA